MKNIRGKIQNIEKIGHGRYGTVYRASIDRQIYAIKILVCETLEEANNGIHEITIVANLKHENIIEYIDSFIECSDNISVHILMPYFKHGDLENYMERKFNLNFEQIIDFSIQILSGIKFLHDNKIIHR